MIRAFGWAMLAALAAYLINNALVVGFGFSYALQIFSGGGAKSAVLIAVYVILISGAIAYALRTSHIALRQDALRIHRFNTYIIRACFWAVFMVGLADVAIALLRTESLLDGFFSVETVRNLGQSHFVGKYIHLPLVALAFVVAAFSRTLGFHWLALLIMIAELSIVISRFVFSYEQASMGDLVRYWYAALFLFASAYTLFADGHVRVDVLYAGFESRTRGFSNALGAILLGMTSMWVILWIGFNGKQSIINAPVMNFEITQQGATGMFIKYQMAAFLGIFAATMLVQFVAFFFEAVADFRGEPGKRKTETAAH